jgi:DNA-binding NarL/FixJ family response regulator
MLRVSRGRQEGRAEHQTASALLLVDRGRSWADELVQHLARTGWSVVRIEDSKLLPFFVLAGGVGAILLEVSSLGMTEAIALRHCREHAPQTSVVVVASEIGRAEVTRALEGGATALIRLDASPDDIQRALESGSRGAPTFHIEESA